MCIDGILQGYTGFNPLALRGWEGSGLYEWDCVQCAGFFCENCDVHLGLLVLITQV